MTWGHAMPGGVRQHTLPNAAELCLKPFQEGRSSCHRHAGKRCINAGRQRSPGDALRCQRKNAVPIVVWRSRNIWESAVGRKRRTKSIKLYFFCGGTAGPGKCLKLYYFVYFCIISYIFVLFGQKSPHAFLSGKKAHVASWQSLGLGGEKGEGGRGG